VPVNVICNSSESIDTAFGVNPTSVTFVTVELRKSDREQQNDSYPAHFENRISTVEMET